VAFTGQVGLWATKASVAEEWLPWFRGTPLPASKNAARAAPAAAAAPAAGHYQSYRSDATDSNSSLFRFVLVSGAGHGECGQTACLPILQCLSLARSLVCHGS